MQLISGSELMSAFGGIDRGLRALKLMCNEEEVLRLAQEAGFDKDVDVKKLRKFAILILNDQKETTE